MEVLTVMIARMDAPPEYRASASPREPNVAEAKTQSCMTFSCPSAGDDS
jgi:hypothetical protein